MDATRNTSTHMLALVRGHRPLRRLLTALAVSQLGDWLYNLALLAFVYDRTHSATWTAATTAARAVPLVLCGPLGGVLADRYDRRRLMIASDVIRTLTMVLLAVVAVAGLPVLLAPVLAALSTVATSVYPPAVAATLPRLVADRELPAANAARTMIQSVAIVAGPVAGGLLLLLGPPAVAFGINAATFALSALVLLGLPCGALFAPAGDDDGAPSVLRDLRAGANALRDNGTAARLVGADIACSVVYGAQTVLLLLLGQRLGYGDAGYGYLLASCGAGGLLGAVIAPKLSGSRQARFAAGAVLFVVAVTAALLAVAAWLATAVALAVVVGAGSVIVEVITDTTLARSLNPSVLARAYGLAYPASVGGIVVGSLVAAPLVTVVGLSWALVAVGAIAAAYAVYLCLPTISRRWPRMATPRFLAAGVAVCLAAGVMTVDTTRADATAIAGDVYVAGTGADSNPCSAPAPCASLTRALVKVASGGAVHLAAGTYVGLTTVPAGLTVTIQGAGAASTTLDGAWAGSVLTVPSAATVRLLDVTVARGNTTGNGGGIANAGTLTVERSQVRDSAGDMGGGIFSDAQSRLTVVDSRVYANQATTGGGVAFIGRTASISGSTVDNNSVHTGGDYAGIVTGPGTMTITNSTVYHNVNAGRAGGIGLFYGELTIRHATVAANSATYGGGVFGFGSLTMSASVVANNLGGNCTLLTGNGPYVNGADDVSSDDTCSSRGTITVPDLRFVEFQDNGGPTPTLLLPHDSPARGAIPVDSGLCDGSDQHGQAWLNPGATSCDAGAVQSTPDLRPSSATVDFGLLGTREKATTSLTVTNVGPVPLHLADPKTTAGYQVTGRGCGTGTTLQPGESCTIGLRFTAAVGTNVGKLSIDYDDSLVRQSMAIPTTGAGTDVPVDLTLPTIVGDAHLGTTLTADPGQWAGSQPISLRYEWWRCDEDGAMCEELVGNDPTYTPVDTDLYWRLRVKVVASNAAGEQESVSSMPIVRP